MIEDVITLAKRYDPAYPGKIRGATPEQLCELEHLVGRPLPDCHREFLLRMGQDMGGLQSEDVSFGIEEVLGFYRDGSWEPPKGYLLLGVHQQDPYLDYYIECLNAEDRDCPVVRFPSDGEFSKQYFFPLEASLLDFLLAQAFIHKRIADLDFRWSFLSVPEEGGAEDAMPLADLARIAGDRARKLGFEELAFSSVNYRFFDQPSAAIVMRLVPDKATLTLTLAGKTPTELERMGDILTQGTPLKRVR